MSWWFRKSFTVVPGLCLNLSSRGLSASIGGSPLTLNVALTVSLRRRDKRFGNNYQIPIAQYIQVTLKNDSGLWEEFHFSNPERLVTFLESLNNVTSSFEEVANG